MAASLKLVVDNQALSEISEHRIFNVDALNVHDLPLAKSIDLKPSSNATHAYRTMLLVLLAHIALFAFLLADRWSQATSVDQSPAPITVSLLPSAVSEQKSEVAPVKQEPVHETITPQPVRMPKKLVVNESQQMSVPPAASAPTAQKEMAQKEVAQANIDATPTPVVSESAKPVETGKEVAVAEEETVIEPPKFAAAYLHNPAPKYPAVSKRTGEQGRVLLKVLVSERGEATEVALDTSSGYERLDQAAIEAVKKWSFVPAKRSNQPVSAYVLVPVKFSLNS